MVLVDNNNRQTVLNSAKAGQTTQMLVNCLKDDAQWNWICHPNILISNNAFGSFICNSLDTLFRLQCANAMPPEAIHCLHKLVIHHINCDTLVYVKILCQGISNCHITTITHLQLTFVFHWFYKLLRYTHWISYDQNSDLLKAVLAELLFCSLMR